MSPKHDIFECNYNNQKNLMAPVLNEWITAKLSRLYANRCPRATHRAKRCLESGTGRLRPFTSTEIAMIDEDEVTGHVHRAVHA